MPRGRPREFDTDTALDRAIELFWRHGYDGTSVSDLTASMGIGMPSLYAAFGSKRELFERATDRYTSSRSQLLLDALAKPTARDVAEAFLEGVIEAATRSGQPAGCFTVQAGLTCSGADHEIAVLLADRRKDTEDALRQRFRDRHIKDTLPDGMTAASLARFVSALAVGINIKAADGVGRRELRALVTPVTMLFGD